MLLYNQLLQRHDEVMKQKRKESTPSVRINSDKPSTPSRKSDFVFTTPQKKKTRIPVSYGTPKRKSKLPTLRRKILADIPEIDEDDDEPLIPLYTSHFTLFQKELEAYPCFRKT